MPNIKKFNARSSVIEHERLASLINSMADGVIALDQHLKVVLYNGAALNILDMNASIKGAAIPRIMNLVDKNNQTVHITQLIRGANTSTATRDYSLKYSDDSTAALYMSIAPVHLGYGKDGAQGYVLLLRDITHEKSLEEERDEFISVVSHELRTPITIAEGSISNALIAVERGTNKAMAIQALKEAHDQTVFLASMINDLSTLSRAERGKLTFDAESINMHEMIEHLTNGYRGELEAKGLQLEVELDPKLEILMSSKLYVEEILQNLITNAIKYTEAGSIRVEAHSTPEGVEVNVQDSGIGISKGDQEKIFDKFFRSEDYRTRQHNGTGLGLYVTMKLLRLLHAELRVSSELNQGSTFTVAFPNIKS